MRKIKIGDEVVYQPWNGKRRHASVEGIEICRNGEKYGRNVDSCDIDKQTGVLDLSDHHWIYFNQVISITKTQINVKYENDNQILEQPQSWFQV